MTDFFENLLSNEELQKKVAELKAENEVLKQALNKEPLAQKALVTAYSGYKKQVLELYKVLDSYKQTLQEIKAIVKKNISYQDTDSTTRAMTKILDLITKAEEE